MQWIFSLDDVLLASVQMTGMAYTPLLWACNLMSAIVPAITCLWAVMVVARSRALMGMVWSVVSLISLSVLSGLITLTLMYVNGFFDGIMDNPSITESPEAMTAMSMETVTMVAVTVGGDRVGLQCVCRVAGVACPILPSVVICQIAVYGIQF